MPFYKRENYHVSKIVLLLSVGRKYHERVADYWHLQSLSVTKLRYASHELSCKSCYGNNFYSGEQVLTTSGLKTFLRFRSVIDILGVSVQ